MTEKVGASRSRWDGWLKDSVGGGHVYQSHEWGEFKSRMGWRPVRLVLEKDGEVTGLGQFLLYQTLPIPGALMYCPKGPWLPWEDEEAVQAFFEGARKVAEREGAHTLKIEPEVREEQARAKNLLSRIGFRKFRWDLNGKATMVVDLSPSEEETLKGMKGKTRYNVRLAAKKGVHVVEDNSAAARERFWRMQVHTSERNGMVMRRPREYVHSVMRTMHEAGNGHLFFAEHEGEPLVSMYVFTFGKKYWYHYGASTDKKRNLMPSYLLQWEVMRWAKRRGMTYYDMMGVPDPENLDESHPWYGIYRFKAGFGGEMADFVGCLDLPVRSTRARLWDKIEPVYYRLYQRLRGNIYY